MLSGLGITPISQTRRVSPVVLRLLSNQYWPPGDDYEPIDTILRGHTTIGEAKCKWKGQGSSTPGRIVDLLVDMIDLSMGMAT